MENIVTHLAKEIFYTRSSYFIRYHGTPFNYNQCQFLPQLHCIESCIKYIRDVSFNVSPATRLLYYLEPY